MKKAKLHFCNDIEDDKKKLLDASRLGHTQRVQKLLSFGFLDIGPGSAWPNHTPFRGGSTPLHWAAKGGHEATAKLLLDAGANLDEEDDHGNTQLHWAARRGHEATVKLLLDAGANPDEKALSLARKWGHREVFVLLRGRRRDIP